MSDLGFNKIAFCVLGTGLALIGLNEASHAFFPHTEHAKDGYFIEIPEAPAAGDATTAVAEGPRDYFKLISSADPEAGKQVAVKCQQCHKFEPGAQSTGPTLYGVVGKPIASEPGFKYSTGPGSLSDQEGAWDYAKLDVYLEAPRKAVPGTAMNFIGLKKQQDRSNILAYLRTLTAGEPYPLPAPLPEQPADVPATPAVTTDPSQPSQGEAGAPPAQPGQPAQGPAPAAPAQPAH